MKNFSNYFFKYFVSLLLLQGLHLDVYQDPEVVSLLASESVSHSVMSNSLRPHGHPGSSVHGILQARILEWVAVPFSRGSSWPRDQTQVSCIAGIVLTVWVIREAHPTAYWASFILAQSSVSLSFILNNFYF